MKIIPKFQSGGSAIRTKEDKKVSRYKRAVYSSINPVDGVPTIPEGVTMALHAYKKSIVGDPDKMEYKVRPVLGDSVADAAWRKRLGLSYNKKFLPVFNGDTVRVPKEIEMEIPTDTTFLKRRIALNKALLKRHPEYDNDHNFVSSMIKIDEEALDSLRKTYKTGLPVGMNEFSNNSRLLILNGEVDYDYISPLNVFRHYNIRYDKPTNRMYYSKDYNFDLKEYNLEGVVPGDSFYIRGYIDLNKK